jgi:hypothetical protein
MPSSRAVLPVTISLAGSVLAAAAFWWLLLLNVDIRLFFTQSDTLFLPALFSDLHHDLGSFQHWHFPAAPSFFPDMLIYAAADAGARRLSRCPFPLRRPSAGAPLPRQLAVDARVGALPFHKLHRLLLVGVHGRDAVELSAWAGPSRSGASCM